MVTSCLLLYYITASEIFNETHQHALNTQKIIYDGTLIFEISKFFSYKKLCFQL